MDWRRTTARRQLMKPGISCAAASSALLGFVMHAPDGDPGRMLVTWGAVLLLAAGGATFNNLQDRFQDAKFARTRHRPLPGARIAVPESLTQAIVLTGLGLIGLLCLQGGFFLPALGLAALGLYNGLYTPLKTRTTAAIVPGAVCGMIPPLIGWVAGGGRPGAHQVWHLMAIFGVWQLPHYWLLMLTYREDYRKAAAASMVNRFSTAQFNRIVFAWIPPYAFLMVLLPAFGMLRTSWITWLVLGHAFCLPLLFTILLFSPAAKIRYGFLFRSINLSIGMLALLLALDRIMAV